MQPDLLQAVLDWVAAHPTWAGAGILLIAFFESLAVVGLFLPGAALMFGVGALVGTGHLDLGTTLIWAAAGAIAGDGVSFWLGRRFHQRLRVMWPFATHPELMARATDFFYRHGGKSVLFGRFVGPIRPVIPAVAGMLDMPVSRFVTVNVISGLLWAPAYVLPGMLFATSLGLAAEVATRLAVLLGLVFTLLFAAAWLARRLFQLIHHRIHGVIRRVLEWARVHPVAGEVPAALLDPAHPEARGLTLLALLLLLASTGFVVLLDTAGNGGLLANVDEYVLHAFQSLRTPLMDQPMVVVTGLGGGGVLTVLFAVVLLWLAWCQRWKAALHWTAAAGFAVALTRLLTFASFGPHPVPLHGGAGDLVFPSAPVTHATVIYGFLAVLIARELPVTRRWLPYALAAPLVGGIALSRLYLGTDWLSGILGGFALGLAWVSLLGIAYQRHPAAPLRPVGLALAALIAVSATAAWNTALRLDADLARYSPEPPPRPVAEGDWWAGGWRALPGWRADLRGVHTHPLTLQYAGPLEALSRRLQARGWRPPVRPSGWNWLQWFGRVTDPVNIPVLPQVHGGRNERLLLVRPDPTGKRRLLALRLWPADRILEPDGVPLWIGNVGYLELAAIPGGLTIPRTGQGFAAALAVLKKDLAGLEWRSVERPAGGGEVLLIRNALSSAHRPPATRSGVRGDPGDHPAATSSVSPPA